MCISIPDIPLVLSVLTPEVSVTEPDSGESTLVTGCFSANLTQPQIMNHMFELRVSPNSTADIGSDYYFNTSSQFLTVPAGVSMYTTCVDVTVIGDYVAEVTELIIVTVVPLLPHDSVAYPQDVRIFIFDNDTGMMSCCSSHICLGSDIKGALRTIKHWCATTSSHTVLIG